MTTDMNRLAQLIKTEIDNMKRPERYNTSISYDSNFVPAWDRIHDLEKKTEREIKSLETKIYNSNLDIDSPEMKILCQKLFLFKIKRYDLMRQSQDYLTCLMNNATPANQMMDRETYSGQFSIVSDQYEILKTEYHLQWCEDENCVCRDDEDRPYREDDRPYLHSSCSDSDPTDFIDEDPC
jgi:hypothetical protein